MANDNKVQFITPVNNDGKTPRTFAVPVENKTGRFLSNTSQVIFALNILGWIGFLLYPDKSDILIWTVVCIINIAALGKIMSLLMQQEKVINELVNSDQSTVIEREKRINEMMEKSGIKPRSGAGK